MITQHVWNTLQSLSMQMIPSKLFLTNFLRCNKKKGIELSIEIYGMNANKKLTINLKKAQCILIKNVTKIIDM